MIQIPVSEDEIAATADTGFLKFTVCIELAKLFYAFGAIVVGQYDRCITLSGDMWAVNYDVWLQIYGWSEVWVTIFTLFIWAIPHGKSMLGRLRAVLTIYAISLIVQLVCFTVGILIYGTSVANVCPWNSAVSVYGLELTIFQPIFIAFTVTFIIKLGKLINDLTDLRSISLSSN